jgi:CubicO group peptidase (beta-lactamase class C family)
MFLALALASLLSSQESRPELARTLEPALAELVRRFRLPGLALGVVQRGEVIYARGFGEMSRGSGRPVTPHSVFHMASVSKVFTASAAMQLVEAGKLELDAPLTKYLPYFRLADEASTTITVRQALTHTSGFPDVEDYQWEKPQHDAGAAERYVRSLASERMVFAPGQGSRYSNMAFDTLGDVIAKAAGMPFEDYVKSHILVPLGMAQSSFIHAETPTELRTQGHSTIYSQRVDQAPCPVYPYNRRHAPSSTLNSNVVDMCRFALANLARGELDGQRILAAKSYDLLWSRDDDTPEIGLGWSLGSLVGRPTVSHSGADVGYNSYLLLLPSENLGVVVMIHSDVSPVGDVARAAALAALGEPFTFPRPRISFEFAHLLENEGFEAASERFFELQETESDKWTFGFAELDEVCDALLQLERNDAAVELATLNADVHPEVCAAFTRLGQALLAAGDEEGAREHFEHALELAPNDATARDGLRALGPTGGR